MNRRAGTAICSLFVLACLCVSCRLFTPGREDSLQAIVPHQFSRGTGALEQPSRWWTSFKCNELDVFVERALSGSLSISQAAARLRQADAVAVQRGAARQPDLSAEASAGVTERAQPLVPEAETRTESYELSLAASYELDLWGRVSDVATGAKLDRDALREDLRSAELAVAGEVTQRYLELLNVRTKLDLVAEQLKTSQQIEELMGLRFRRSQATALDVLQQRENVALVEALAPPLKAREELLLNELAVFAGLPAGTDLELVARRLPALPELPATGLPSELLGRRPDVRAAARRLESADRGVSAARADRLPALRITATGGYSRDDVSELFDNWIARLAGSLAGPVLDGGRRRAEVERARAAADERLGAYRATVLQAVREVEDALVLEQRQADLLAALDCQLKTAVLSRSEAYSRYRKGMESYLSVLVSLNSVQRLERQLADAVFDRMAYRVRLHRALAGGWDEQRQDSDR